MTRLVLLLPLLLAACGSEEIADNAANAANASAVVPLPEGPKLAGVRLWHGVRASGTRPFWSMEIAPGQIRFTDFEGKGGGHATDLYPVDPALAANSATYATQTPAGERVTARLTAETCLEGGKPVVEQPLKAEIRIGARVLTGCARQAPAPEIGAAPVENATQAR